MRWNQEDEFRIRKSKPIRKTRGKFLIFHFPQSSQSTDGSLTQGTIKGKTNLSCLQGGKPRADLQADGSVQLKMCILFVNWSHKFCTWCKACVGLFYCLIQPFTPVKCVILSLCSVFFIYVNRSLTHICIIHNLCLLWLWLCSHKSQRNTHTLVCWASETLQN